MLITKILSVAGLAMLSGYTRAFAQLPEKVLAGALKVSTDAGVEYAVSFADSELANYNVINLFMAYPNSDGSLRFNVHEKYGSLATLRRNVQALRQKQVRVLLTVGGANAPLVFDRAEKVGNFVKSFIKISESLGGLDGVDWNTFEQASSPNPGILDQRIGRMIDATRQLKNRFGPNFLVTMPPSVSFSQQENDQRVAHLFHESGMLSYAYLQFYDGQGNDAKRTFEDRTTSWTEYSSGRYTCVRPRQFGFGFDFGYESSTIKVVTDAVKNAVKIWREVGEPNNLRGVYKFDIGKDKHNEYVFTKAFAFLGNTPSLLMTRYDSKCLDYNYHTGEVHMYRCHGGKNQKWYLDGDKLKTRHDNKCLDYNYHNGNVYMHRCHGGSNQKWLRMNPGMVNTDHDDKCLDYNYHTGNLYMGRCHGGSNQKYLLSKNGELKSLYNDKCADYDPRTGKVYMGRCHGGKNQKWYLDGEHLKTRQDNKCLDYNYHNGNVYMGRCHGGNNQKFTGSGLQ